MKTEEGTSGPPRRRRWRWLRRIGMALVAVPIVLYVTRAWTLNPWALALASRLAAGAGYELEAQRLSGNWWHGLTLEGLRLESTAEGGPWLQAQAKQVQLEWSLPQLLRGGLAGLHAVRADALKADIDTTALGSSDTPPTERGPGFQWPRAWPDLELTGGELSLKTAARTFELRDIAAHMARGNSVQPVTLRTRLIEGLGLNREVPVELSAEWNSGRVEQLALTLDNEPWVKGGLIDLGAASGSRFAGGLPLAFESDKARLAWRFEAGAIEADVELDGLALERLPRLLRELTGERLAGSLNLEAHVVRETAGARPTGSLELGGAGLRVGAFEFETLDARLTASADAAAIERLEVAAQGQTLRLEEPVPFELGAGRVAVRDLRLLTDPGAITLDGSWTSGDWSAQLALQACDLRPLLPTPLVARAIDGHVTLAGGAGLSATVDLTIGELRYGSEGDPLRGRLVGSVTPDSVDASGSIDLDSSTTLALGAGLGTVAFEQGLHGAFDLQGSWHALTGGVTLDAASLSVPELTIPEGLAVRGPAQGELHVALRLGPSGLVAERVRCVVARAGHLDATGALQLEPDLAAWLRAPDEWRDWPCEANGSLELPSLAWLARLAPGLRRTGGRLSGSFDFDGTLGTPRGQADLELEEGSLRLPSLPPIERIRASATLRESRFELTSMTGEMGAAPVTLTGFYDLGERHQVDFQIDGEEVLLLRNRDLRLRADLDLALRGPVDAMHLSGSIQLRRTRLRQEVDLFGALQGRKSPERLAATRISFADEGPLARMTVDLTVVAVEPIEVRSNLAAADLRGTIKLAGTGAEVIPEGSLFLENASLKLPGGKLRFDSGLVRLERTRPFVVQLDLVGEAQLAGYDVTVHVTETASDPLVDLSSSPPLAKDALLVLLLTGRPPDAGSRDAAARSLTVYVAKDLLSRWSSGGVDDDGSSWLDRLEIQTGRELSRSGLSTLEATWRLGDTQDNERTWYVTAERDRYEDVNFGLRFVVRLR